MLLLRPGSGRKEKVLRRVLVWVPGAPPVCAAAAAAAASVIVVLVHGRSVRRLRRWSRRAIPAAAVVVMSEAEAERREAAKGLATLCIGGGMGIAMCVGRD